MEKTEEEESDDEEYNDEEEEDEEQNIQPRFNVIWPQDIIISAHKMGPK